MVTSFLHGAPTTVLATADGMLDSVHAAEPTAAALRIARLLHDAVPSSFDVMAAEATPPGARDATLGCGHGLAAPGLLGIGAALPDWNRDCSDAPTPRQARVVECIVVRLTGREAAHG